ncbi:maleylpyruvate isomerase family mycothiol-dependent enzyme [Streptomyces sp. NPDC008313]|uniref:maleylpyruvate isomerase family mycothiol-dependent enzyme n=1 Tax=Streptomyces sp. NPDC008313 TaxID=3364826 RepID=UPI0036E5B5D9
MEIAEHLHVLDREGRLLAASAEETGPDAKVAACPGWQVRDLLRHTGMVHRWATAFVAEGHTSYHPDGGLPDLDGAALLAWFREGHRLLVDSLGSAPGDLRCWTFLPAPSPLAFWARRQAHETAVHRYDAQSARDAAPDPVEGDVAVDGIDELLTGFHAREKSRVRTPKPRVLRVHTTDTDAAWTVRLSHEAPAAERAGRSDEPDADCELSGPAGELYLSLWNRLPFPEVTGDAALATLWREKSQITWG